MRSIQSLWLLPLVTVASCTAAATPTDQSAVQRRVIEIVATHFEVVPTSITVDSNFFTDLKADSLDYVELVIAFEEEFGVMIDDDSAVNLCTVGQMTRYIERVKK